MEQKLAGVLLLLVLVGCAAQPQKTWYKAGATEEQFRRDSMSCQQLGMQSAAVNGLSGNIFVSMWVKDEAIKRLNNLGYRQR